MADANMYIMNPVFQAESFNEMVQPLALYAQAYKEQETKIEDMTDKAAALEWIANQNPDSQTAALYRDMSAKIKGIRDDMMINGLQGGTRSRILGARRMYSANAAEITRRYEDMLKYQQRMEQLYDKDNSIVFSPESQNVSLDDFAGGKKPQIKAISGNEIMARGAAVGKRLTSQMFGDGVVGQEMGGQFWKMYKERGMNDQALASALRDIGQSDKFSLVKQVIDGVYNSFNDFDPTSQQVLKDRFIEGVYAGSTYERDVDYKPNEAYLNPLQLAQKQATIDENKRANERWQNEKDEYAILSGQPFTIGNDTYVYNRTDNKYHNLSTGAATDAPTTVTGSVKGNSKTNKTGKAAKAKVVGIDENGQRIDVTNGTPKGKPMKVGTPEASKEWNDAWNMIRAAHPDIQPGEYRLYKEVQESSSEEAGKTKKVRYYAQPIENSSSATPGSNTTSAPASSGTTQNEPII